MFTKIITTPYFNVATILGGGNGKKPLQERLPSFPGIITNWIIPVSDAGGSSGELIPVYPDIPAIGDIRSTLINLARKDTPESRSVEALLHHRLSTHSYAAARQEFLELLHNTSHELWRGVPDEFASFIRVDLLDFLSTTGRKAPEFNYKNGSLGNFYFLQVANRYGIKEAIWQFSSITGIQNSKVIPCLLERLDIGVELAISDVQQKFIIGQNTISHPPASNGATKANKHMRLPAPIKRLFYVGKHRDEVVQPHTNSDMIKAIKNTDLLIYAMGSFWTSIMPHVILPRVGEATATKNIPKPFLLNGTLDRETTGMDAVKMLKAIKNGFNSHHPMGAISDYVTHIFTPENGQIPVDEQAITKMGVKVVSVKSLPDTLYFQPDDLMDKLFQLL